MSHLQKMTNLLIDFCRSFRGLKRKVNLVPWRIVSIYTIQVPIFQSSTIQICLGIDHCILCQFFFCFLVLADHLQVELRVNTVCHSVLNSFSVQLDEKEIHCKWIIAVYEYWNSLYDFHLYMYIQMDSHTSSSLIFIMISLSFIITSYQFSIC